MFCSSCGKELPNDVAFCPYCGKKAFKADENFIQQENRETNNFEKNSFYNNNNNYQRDFQNNYQYNNEREYYPPRRPVKQGPSYKEKLTRYLEDLGKSKISLFFFVILLLVCCFTGIGDNFSVGALGLEEGFSLYTEADISFIYILVYLASIFLVLFPLFFDKDYKKIYFLLSEICIILTILITAVTIIIGCGETSGDGFSSIANFNITATGYIHIISLILALVYSFKAPNDIYKELYEQDDDYYEDEYYEEEINNKREYMPRENTQARQYRERPPRRY